MMHNKIVPAVFSYFFEDLNVLPAVLFTIAYRLPNFSYFKIVLGLFQIHSEKLLTRSAVLVINMPSWSTHEIELLICEIEEGQCLWNIFQSRVQE